MSIPSRATHIVLAERPKASLTASTFARDSVPIPTELGPDDILIRVDWISLDPAMRGWLKDTRSYIPPVQIGERMRAQGLGTVIKGGGNTIKVGDTVRAMVGMFPAFTSWALQAFILWI